MDYIKGLRDKLAQVERDISDLKVRRTLLRELLSEAGDTSACTVATSPEGPPEPQNGQMGSTEALIRYVRDHPGSRGKTIIGAVLPHVSTNAQDPTRNLYSILSTLTRRGKLSKDRKGGYRLAESA